jgi:hypothetical protein
MTDPAPEAAASGTPPAPAPPPPELEPAETAFQRGDFRAARQLTDQLLAAQPSPEVEAAARSLQARLSIDPWAFRIALIAAALLTVIIGAYVV